MENNQELNKVLSAIQLDIAVIKTEIVHIKENSPVKQHEDHERRIRTLEEFKSRFNGAVAFGTAIGSLIGTVLTLAITLMVK